MRHTIQRKRNIFKQTKQKIHQHQWQNLSQKKKTTFPNIWEIDHPAMYGKFLLYKATNIFHKRKKNTNLTYQIIEQLGNINWLDNIQEVRHKNIIWSVYMWQIQKKKFKYTCSALKIHTKKQQHYEH